MTTPDVVDVLWAPPLNAEQLPGASCPTDPAARDWLLVARSRVRDLGAFGAIFRAYRDGLGAFVQSFAGLTRGPEEGNQSARDSHFRA